MSIYSYFKASVALLALATLYSCVQPMNARSGKSSAQQPISIQYVYVINNWFVTCTHVPKQDAKGFAYECEMRRNIDGLGFYLIHFGQDAVTLSLSECGVATGEDSLVFERDANISHLNGQIWDTIYGSARKCNRERLGEFEGFDSNIRLLLHATE